MAATQNRAIHLVDIENLLGRPRPTRAEVLDGRQRYLDLVRPGPGDHVILACNHGAILEVGLAWPGCRLVARSGTDGADRALLEVIRFEAVEQRFEAVVVASGDGIFASAVARLAGAGIDVVIVSRACALSRRLRLAAKDVRHFDSPEFGQEAA